MPLMTWFQILIRIITAQFSIRLGYSNELRNNENKNNVKTKHKAIKNILRSLIDQGFAVKHS